VAWGWVGGGGGQQTQPRQPQAAAAATAAGRRGAAAVGRWAGAWILASGVGVLGHRRRRCLAAAGVLAAAAPAEMPMPPLPVSPLPPLPLPSFPSRPCAPPPAEVKLATDGAPGRGKKRTERLRGKSYHRPTSSSSSSSQPLDHSTPSPIQNARSPRQVRVRPGLQARQPRQQQAPDRRAGGCSGQRPAASGGWATTPAPRGAPPRRTAGARRSRSPPVTRRPIPAATSPSRPPSGAQERAEASGAATVFSAAPPSPCRRPIAPRISPTSKRAFCRVPKEAAPALAFLVSDDFKLKDS
jgi:hypothetical protein